MTSDLTLKTDVRPADGVPVYEADLFSEAALRNPFEHYRAIRDLGAVVRLRRPDVYAIGRFKDVQLALRSPEVLISSRGVGFNDIFNEITPRPPVIQSDGEQHRKLRNALMQPLMPGQIKAQRQVLKDLILEQIGGLLDGDWFDAIPALARHLPLQAVAHLVGLPDAARTSMLRWATATFNAIGPIGPAETPPPQMQIDLDTRREVRAYLGQLNLGDLRTGSWGAYLFESVEAGRLTLEEARAGIASYVLPSLDTTINAKSSLLYNLASQPEQWSRLRAERELIPSAVLEGVRHSAVVRWFSRVAVTDYIADEVTVPAGGRVMLMYGSANRDERHYPDPDRFDVARKPTDQLGWGTGPHICAGMHLARIEMEVLLEALVELVTRIEIGEPVLGANQGLYGIDSLPMRLHAR